MPIVSDVTAHSHLRDLLSHWWTVNVLVVTDTIVSFGPEQDPRNLNEDYFGMGHLMGVLEGIASVTRAHRQTDPLSAPDVLGSFRFDRHDLSRYDQIWLAGYDSGTLPQSEQAAIAAFMNKGGGVFATGDHATLGSALAGHLPRVRSMRRWDAPPPLGLERVDTTMPDLNNIVVFENQSDDIPQKLMLKLYPWSAGRWYRESYPHPVLCSPSGPISGFPDHMHEGEIVLPASLDQVVTLPGMTFDEYPVGSTGERVAPEIVAWGWTSGRASPAVMSDVHFGADTAATPRWTGAVGVYDGRKAGVGRIVVDSTWHHIFDINLTGDNAANRPSVTDPRAAIWRKGFTYSAAGLQALANIDQYFRNVVHWLSPGKGRPFDALVVELAMSHKLREVLDTRPTSALALGEYAWNLALRRWPPCRIIELVFEPIYERIPFPILPWDEPVPGPDDGPLPPWPIPPKFLAQAALGGALIALNDIDSLEELQRGDRSDRLRHGAAESVARTIERELHLSTRGADRLTQALHKLKDDQQYGTQ